MKISIKNAFKKLFIYPFRYKVKDDYKVEKYWKDRFQKYGDSLKGVGNEGLSLAENKQIYERAQVVLNDAINGLSLDLDSAKVLEIGPGVGFYTNYFCNKLKLKNITAMDITDHYFSDLGQKFPSYDFVKKDISTDDIDGQYDVIFFIDVVEHIVKDEKFKYAIKNIWRSLNKGGYFIISGYKIGKSRKSLFYVKSWSKDDILFEIDDFSLDYEKPFRRTNIMAIKKI